MYFAAKPSGRERGIFNSCVETKSRGEKVVISLWLRAIELASG